jgi:gamma-glutamylcyclotransferase (GGCT)/AIG2-like uncharacterized protein YtfP
MRVFVYGTLKQGYGNNRLLSKAKFIMFGHGFPVVFKDDGGHKIIGEIYDIGDNGKILADLDALEGEGAMYDRKEVSVMPLNGDGAEFMTCSMYIGNTKYWGTKSAQNEKFLDDNNRLDWQRA